jgi:hypothetical protein
VVCPGLRWPSNDHCYTAQPASRALRTTAESTCNAAGGGHVATFASEEELSAAAAYAHDAGANDFWVGLVDDAFRYAATAPNEPGWSPQCAGCYAHTDDPSVALHLPRDVEAGAGCVISTYVAAGTPAIPPWDQHPCDSLVPIHVLCEREPVGSHARACDGGVCMDLVFTAGRKRYLFVANPMGAHEADAFCAARGGTLVVLESREEREQLWRELAQLGQVPVKVWIGLSLDDAGVWTWDDGTKVDAAYPPPWAVRQPLDAGVQALMQNDPNGTVDDTLAMTATDAGMALPFVCETRTSKARVDAGL